MQRSSVFAFILLVLAAVRADTSSDLASLQEVNPQDLLNNITSLSGGPSLNASHIPTPEEVGNAFKKKCLQNSDEQAFDKAMESQVQVSECVQSLANTTELRQEVEKAKPTGDLDVVFRKYCRKSPVLQSCITNFTAGIEPCLDGKEKESLSLIQNITESLISFVCFKEGDRIALFIAEGGPECFEEKKDEIQGCLNKTVSQYLPNNTSSMDAIPSLVLEEPECRDMKLLQICVVKVLEGCSEPTPANIVESLFNYVWQMTPCHGMKSLSRIGADPNSAPLETAATLGLTVALLLLALALGARV